MSLSYFSTFLFVQLASELTICVVALWHWKRTGQQGFAWFGAAFAAASIKPLLDLYLVIYWVPRRFQTPEVWYATRVLPFLSVILFTAFTLRGLQSFSWPQVSATARFPDRRPAWQVTTIHIRRFFFAMTGLVFVGVGPLVALRGGSLVGSGCTTGLIGLVCLWLAWHPGSPLRRTAAGRPDAKSVHDDQGR